MSRRREPIDLIVDAMARVRRRQTRAEIAGGVTSDRHTQIVRVLDAIREPSLEPGGSVTVGGVATRLGVDPSQASRLVAEAVSAGAVVREASQSDGRRSVLVPTDVGVRLLDEARTQRRARFASATADWSATDLDRFAGLLVRFVDALDAAD